LDTSAQGIFEYATVQKIENSFYKIALEKLVDTVLKKIIKSNTVQAVIPEKLPIIKGDKYRLEKLFSYYRHCSKIQQQGNYN